MKINPWSDGRELSMIQGSRITEPISACLVHVRLLIRCYLIGKRTKSKIRLLKSTSNKNDITPVAARLTRPTSLNSQGPLSKSRKYFLEVERRPWERGCPKAIARKWRFDYDSRFPFICQPSVSFHFILRMERCSTMLQAHCFDFLSKAFGKREKFIIVLKENNGEPSVIS